MAVRFIKFMNTSISSQLENKSKYEVIIIESGDAGSEEALMVKITCENNPGVNFLDITTS